MPFSLKFQIDFFYEVDFHFPTQYEVGFLLMGIQNQQSGSTAQWNLNKTSVDANLFNQEFSSFLKHPCIYVTISFVIECQPILHGVKSLCHTIFLSVSQNFYDLYE